MGMVTLHIRAIESDFNRSFTEHYEAMEIDENIVDEAIRMSAEQYITDPKGAVAMSISCDTQNLLMFHPSCKQYAGEMADKVNEWLVKQVTG